MPGEVLNYVSLREAKISKDTRATSIMQPAVPASQALPLTPWSPIYVLHSTRPPRVLPQHIQPISLILWKQQNLQYTTGNFQCISLYRVLTKAAQLHNLRWTKTCVLLAKNLSSHVLSCACFNVTSFLLCQPQQNVS